MSATGLAFAFGVALLAIEVLRRSRVAGLFADRPNERSLHRVPTPRVGGLGLLVGALPVAFAFSAGPLQATLGIAAGLALLSAIDDIRSLPASLRLACHLAAAVAVVALVPPAAPALPWASLALTVLAVPAIAWMLNLFNFMDGADGLAGGMAAIGFATLAAVAHRAGTQDLAMAAGALAAASLAFLAFNFPPARVFLGDAGSVPLGFLAGALAWQGWARGTWPAWFPLLVFSPFIVDATLTLARRLAARERLWQAHRSHYYQRLVLGGWTHRQLAVRAGLLMILAATSALVALEGPAILPWGILAAWVVAYAVIVAGIDRRHPRKVP